MAKREIAIVYDWMDSWGGVERMLLILNEMFPEAKWYTSYVDEERAQWVRKLKVKTSFIQSLPSFIKKSRILSLPFYPYAFESFDLKGYDLVISVTSSFAKSVITGPGTRHICILLTPTRWLWSHGEMYDLGCTNFDLCNPIKSWVVRKMQAWDMVAASRPDKIISISQTVADRCLKYYDRKSEVVYPPFDIEYWKSVKRKTCNAKRLFFNEYYLIVSRLEPYKKVDLVIVTFNKMKDKKLIIVGKGTQEQKLKAIAGENTRFIQDISDQELADLYLSATALIMPQEEDFGYVALEAQFFGCPVIAYAKGGATETVIPQKTGIFFSDQTVSSLQDAVAEVGCRKYNLGGRYGHLKRFSKEKFVHKLESLACDL